MKILLHASPAAVHTVYHLVATEDCQRKRNQARAQDHAHRRIFGPGIYQVLRNDRPRRLSYVALGDSYSAGEGLSPYLAGSHQSKPDDMCDRSAKAYGPLLDLNDHLGSFAFAACSGAVTADLVKVNHAYSAERAQINDVAEDTRVITLTIGGNDAGFASVLQTCIRARPNPQNWHGYGCSQDDALKKAVENRIAALAGIGSATSPAPNNTHIVPIATLIALLHARAPQAHIYVAGYPPLFGSQKDNYKSARTAPSHFACDVWRRGPVAASIDYNDSQWLNQQEAAALDRAIRDGVSTARRNGITAKFIDVTDNFAGHALCDSKASWIQPLLITAHGKHIGSGSFHPTTIGQQSGYEAAFAVAKDL